MSVLVADDRKRVTLPNPCQSRDRFEVKATSNGFVLRRLVPAEDRAPLVRPARKGKLLAGRNPVAKATYAAAVRADRDAR
ncbi:MAG: hypothetical protein ABMA26_15045 [Limisphaerales bacterium]